MKIPGKDQVNQTPNKDNKEILYFSGEGHSLIDQNNTQSKFEEPIDLNDRRKLIEEATLKRMQREKKNYDDEFI